MIRRIKRSAIWIAAISLMAGMISTVAVAPANATVNASTRLVGISGDLGTAPVDDPATATGNAGYYNAQLAWKDAFVTAGETFTLTFEVKAAGGNLAQSGDSVTLYANTSYSGSHGAITETGSNTVVNAAGAPGDGASLSGTVGANGLVSFTFHNTNVDAEVLAAPSDVNTAKTSDSLGGVFSNFVLKYEDGSSTLRTGDNGAGWGAGWGADTQDADIVSIHFVKSSQGGGGGGGGGGGIIAASHGSPQVARVSTNPWSATGLQGSAPIDATSDGRNWFLDNLYLHDDNWFLSYADAGSQITLKWHVTDSAGTILPNQAVTLKTKWSGSSIDVGNGAAPGDAATWTASGLTNGEISGTTDSSGDITFVLTNTNTVTGTRPTNLTTQSGALDIETAGSFPWARFALVIGSNTLSGWPNNSGVNQVTDLIDVILIPASGGGGGGGIVAASHGSPQVARVSTNPWSATGLEGSAPIDASSDGRQWFLNSYYNSSDYWLLSYADAGAQVTLKWHVTDSAGTILPNQAVTLKTQWAGSAIDPGSGLKPGDAATWTASGLTNGEISGTTDNSGDVTFVLTNTNTVTGNRPSSLTSQSGALAIEDAGTFPWARFALVIGSNTVSANPNTTVNQVTDLIDVILIPASGGGGGGSVTPNARISLSSSDASTMTDKSSVWWRENSSSHSYVKMVIAGATLTLHYHVTDETGTAISGATVTLAKSTTNGGDFSGSLTGTTDSSGDVVFTLTNTNTNAQSEPYPEAPSSINYWEDSRGNMFPSQATEIKVDFVPSVTGYEAISRDRVWTHIVAAQGAESNKKRLAIVSLEDNPNYFVVEKAPETKQSASLDATAGTYTCNNASSKLTPTLAVYYLIVDNRPTAGLRFGKFDVSRPLYPSINAIADGSATATSATFKLDKSWNANGHSARLQCVIQTGAALNTVVLKTPVTLLKGVGKYKKPTPIKVWTPKKVTMRLVEPAMTKDASGKPINFVDMSASPVQDHWSQYYGSSDGGLGVFYKYLEVGSTTTFKYKVTDSETKQPVPFFKVWLVVNKNYGGVENASFTYENNGVVYKAAGHSGEFGESQFEGLTDANGYVSFTLVNTNSASEAEPKPAALNQEQPKSVSTTCFSTITLMAHLGSDETMETKDFIWAHIVQK